MLRRVYMAPAFFSMGGAILCKEAKRGKSSSVWFHQPHGSWSAFCCAGKSWVFTLISQVVVSTLKFLHLYSYFSAERRKPSGTWKQKPFALDQMCAFADHHATCRTHMTYPVCNDAVSLILKIELTVRKLAASNIHSSLEWSSTYLCPTLLPPN